MASGARVVMKCSIDSRSELARRAFSAPVHQHLLELATEELNVTRQHVTDWEIRRGFENA